jgi:hypothetical protein
MPENWAGQRQPLTPPKSAPPPPPALGATQPAAAVRSAASGAAGFFAAFGITMALLGAAAAAASLLRRRRSAYAPLLPRKAADAAASDGEPACGTLALASREAEAEGYDVFLSYRRADYRVADAVHDKLRLCGLRVFKDAEGRLAGTQFSAELVRTVRCAPVFAPLVTLGSLQRLAGAAEADAQVDACLAEWLAALHFRAAGGVRLIHPLLAGEPPPAQASAAVSSSLHHRFESSLSQNDPRYAAALAALPDAAPAATVRAVSAALRAIGDAPLTPEEAAMSVRDIVAGAAGVLAGPVLALDCAPEDLGLYIRSRYAPPMLRVAEEARAQAAANGGNVRRTSQPQ